MRQFGEKRLEEFLDAAVGNTDQLLVETGNRGHGRNFTKIRLDGAIHPSGQLINVDIVKREGDTLVGRAHTGGARPI